MISLKDKTNTIYDPNNPVYWNEDSLHKEMDRVFDICHGCRMCFNYCGSFPSLFEAIDERADGIVSNISQEDKEKVVSECFQCKICYVKCPYTDQDNHEYDLNFPALMQRSVHIKAKKNGVSFKDKILQNVDLAGKMNSGWMSFIINRLFQNNFCRSIFQFILGIHKNKKMPSFAKIPFAKWYKSFRKENKAIENSQLKAVLFSTCFVNYNDPQIGKDALFVLEKNNVKVIHPEQNCCGMPALNSGDLKLAIKKMKQNIESLYPYAEQGYHILAINPTCSLTLKKEYMLFLPKEWREKAELVSKMTRDLNEYLLELKKADQFNYDFQSDPGNIGYHIPCHLRAQNIGYCSLEVMRLIPGAKVSLVEECSGHNGNWAMKKDFFDLSLKVGKKAFEGLKNSNADKFSSDCPLAGVQLGQGMDTNSKTLHPISILARSYKKPAQGGFD